MGPVFWKFNFEKSKSSKVYFKANKYEQLFCTIYFEKQDTISIKSKLNAYTSNHKTSDSFIHEVIWPGDKYISFLLNPFWLNDKFNIDVKGITVSGKFSRTDDKIMAKNQIKTLIKILKREFKILFKTEGIAQLLSNKLDN